jgi:hypothetical protein
MKTLDSQIWDAVYKDAARKFVAEHPLSWNYDGPDSFMLLTP